MNDLSDKIKPSYPVLNCFNDLQLQEVHECARISEELVNNHFKFSESQWSQIRYDVKTLKELSADEIVFGPFAQVLRYVGRKKGNQLESQAFDYYKICIQDHAILDALKKKNGLFLFPFTLYNITHELVHIVRFGRFMHNFFSTEEEKIKEEARVHHHTREILHKVPVTGMNSVFRFYDKWLGNH